MKKHLKVINILLCIFLLAGCATIKVTTVPKKYIGQVTWSETTKDKVFAVCLTALQMGDFSIHPLGTSKESGLIIVNKVNFYPFSESNEVQAHYKLQILVSELLGNKVMVDINVKASRSVIGDPSWRYWNNKGETKKEVLNRISNRVSEDLEKFFTQLNVLLGKTGHYGDDKVLEWK